MKNFIYLIGASDDFESIDDLKEYYYNDPDMTDVGARCMSVFPISLSEGCVVQGYNSIEEIATIIGRGEAFYHDWTTDDTISVLLDVEATEAE